MDVAIGGCSYRLLNGRKIISKQINYLENLNNDIFPNRDEYDKYSSIEIDGIKKSLIPISSSRGCPFACSFCSVSMLNSRWRARSVENVIKEINSIYQNDKNIAVVFIDDNFFVIPKRSLQIMRFLKSKNIKFIFATRVDQLIRAKATLKEIKDCGCISIELGIENGSDSMLSRFNKKTVVESNIEALRLCSLNNLTVSIDFITFDNETSIEELKENVLFFKKSGLWGKYPIFFYNRVYPYEGTKYFNIIKDSNKYFIHTQVELVYNKLMQFGVSYQPILNRLYNILLCKNFKTIQEKIDFVLVKTLPYIIFENLVLNSGKYDIDQYGNTIELLKKRYIKENE